VLVVGMVVVSLGMAPVFAVGTEQIIASATPAWTKRTKNS